MKTSSKKSKKNLLALCLSFLMVASGASAFASCGNNEGNSSSDSSSSDTSTSVNSDLKISNGDFETFNTNKGLNVIGTSVSGWTSRRTSSKQSYAASGIVNLSEWDQLTTSKYDGDFEKLSEAEAKKLFETDGALTIKDKLAYYDAWKKSNSGSTISTELKDFYKAYNIDSEDLPMDIQGKPLQNPLTHDYSDAAGEADYGKGTNVLMIHNQTPEQKSGEAVTDLVGAAQKFSSSTTVTLQAGTAASFSVWVKTMDLKVADSQGNPQDAVNKGAFINVTHSVGSKSLPDLCIKNIDTASVTDNNGWKQYTFYLKGSAYTSTTFTIELGLGLGSTNHYEYVNGYAFFDDIECQTLSYEKYEALLTNVDQTFDFADDADAKTVATNGDMSKDTFELNLYYGLQSVAMDSFMQNGEATATSTTRSDGSVVTSQKGNNVYETLGEGFDSANDVLKVFDNAAAIKTAGNSNAYLKAVYNNYFTDKDGVAYDFAADEKVLMMLSADGVAYTWDAHNAFSFADYTDSNGNTSEYLALSFFAKTSDMKGLTGATVTLKDGYNSYPITSIDTTSISPVKVDLDADGVADDDVYDGWQQYFFFVKNEYVDQAQGQFSLTFNLGPTTITDTTTESYIEGFAAFTKFEVYPMTKAEYDSVSSGTYAQVVSVTGNTEETATGDSGFDSAANVPSNAIKEGFANPMNYMGVFSDSYRVNQNGAGGTHNETDNYAYAGLLNREHFADYFTAPQGETVLLIDKLKSVTGKTTADDVWNSMFGYNFAGSAAVGSRTQPLLIWNNASADTDKDSDGVMDKAYGYIAKNNVSVSANSYKKVSIAVKVGALNAASADDVFAYLYLVDADDKTYSSPLSIGRSLTYWYDDKGNVCADEDCKTIAFNLQSNGLYIVNKNWKAYKALSEEQQAAFEGYFANLEGYEKDENGNLLIADGGVERDYGKWDSQGLDGIAYYYNAADGKYYARYDKDSNEYSLPVTSLKTVTKTSDSDEAHILPYRYLAEGDQQLMAKVGNTNGAWVNVTFYIHTGSVAKNYRLEVWSGDRNGKGNPTDTFVAFDTNYAADAESQFTALISEYESNKTSSKYAGATAFEKVFSWYDSPSYLRYDKGLDENKYGDLYAESYTYSSYEAGTAFLAYKDGNEWRYFADYSFEDVTLTPASIDNDTDDDTSSDDTTTSTSGETNFFMLFSSIAIAAILVFVVAAVIVRKVLKKTGRLHKKSAAKGKKEKKAKSVKAEKSAKTEKAETTDETDQDSPYND